MQRVKSRFYEPDGGRHGSLQSCIRTDDLELVGDGSHLTGFQMVGNFSFGGGDYPLSVELWHSILTDLHLEVSEVHCHPRRDDHRRLWERWGYPVVDDPDCTWSDGQIGGECCELYCHGLEIGNLVNPLGRCVDVGFGWERLHQILEQVSRVEQTTLFDPTLPPVVSDHLRTLSLLHENGVEPGPRGRSYVCRRLLRRVLRQPETLSLPVEFSPIGDWLDQERELRERCLRQGRRLWRKYRHQTPEFWWQSFGIMPEELELLE